MPRQKKTKDETPSTPVDNSTVTDQTSVVAEPEMGVVSPRDVAPTKTTVEVDVGVLQGIMDQLKASTDRIKTLEGITGKNAIQSWLEGHKDNTVKRAHLKIVDGSPVVSWSKLLKNSVIKMQNGVYAEELLMHIRLANGETKEMRCIDFIHEQGIKLYNIVKISDDLATSAKTMTLEDELGHQPSNPYALTSFVR